MAFIAFVVANLELILLLLLALSEWLAQTKRVKANSVLQLVIHLLKSMKKDDKVG